MKKGVAVLLMFILGGGGYYVYYRYNHDHRFRYQMNQRMESVREWYENTFFEDKALRGEMADAGSVKSWNQQQRDFHEGRIGAEDMLKNQPQPTRHRAGSKNRASGTDSSWD